MSKEQNTKTDEVVEAAEGLRIYELGFHFVPTVSEDEIAVQFSHLKSLIEKRGGTFIAEGTPEMVSLAYDITKTVKAQKRHYSSAYFGWVKFEINPDEIAGLEKEVKAFDPVLRFLLIITVRENTYIGPKEIAKKSATREAAPTDAPAAAEAVVSKTAAEAAAAPVIDEVKTEQSA